MTNLILGMRQSWGLKRLNDLSRTRKITSEEWTWTWVFWPQIQYCCSSIFRHMMETREFIFTIFWNVYFPASLITRLESQEQSHFRNEIIIASKVWKEHFVDFTIINLWRSHFKILGGATFQILVCARITCAISLKHSGTRVPWPPVLNPNVWGGAQSSFFFTLLTKHTISGDSFLCVTWQMYDILSFKRALWPYLHVYP